jgi:hypothetical protein
MNSIEKQQILEKAMQAIAGAVEDTFNETVGSMGYALIVFELGRPGIGNYISNAQRADMIKALRETADRLERNQDIAPGNFDVQ